MVDCCKAVKGIKKRRTSQFLAVQCPHSFLRIFLLFSSCCSFCTDLRKLCSNHHGQKKTCSKFSSLEDIKSPMTNTTIHGAVTAISPIKKGRKSIFFEGMLTDNTSTIRVVRFNVIQQKNSWISTKEKSSLNWSIAN